MATKDPAKRKASNARYYAKNKQRFRDAARSYQARNIAFILEQKQRPCADCGAQYPHYVMDFDHVRGVKIGNISEMVRDYSLAALKAEVAKCELVCANCHRIRTWQRLGDAVDSDLRP